jgi:hypothetical protein
MEIAVSLGETWILKGSPLKCLKKKKSDDLNKQGFGQVSRKLLKEEEYGRTLPAMDLENTGIR